MGVPQKVMEGTSKIYEPSEIKDMLKFLMGVMPRSGNLISTVSAEGVTNVAPYALCTCISFNPPIISLTVGRKPNGKKDTEINIDETNEFSVNIVTESCLASTMAAAGEFPHNVSEFEKVGFTKKDSTVIKAPLVAQCPVNMECKVISRTPFTDKEGNETCIVYNAEVAKIHILDSIYDNSDARFNYEKFGLIAKLGGFQYNRINSLLEITSAQQ
ncbi:hypothetical protein BCR36DRAFT_585951 [Piromyces finnis]|uniref:Flavin reductase like domain-containing protein n=1 Tax=Piromyces finnis TaxID=1754191 RepID=A0A1Y1V2C8_9FUNG|nr:hypothetical protein BCR36DRAFT_585951 [Piromyces finnis]|eukprot:ORX44830.1 hypothetical protein BCR36DRAFT_585951 [Piromyces finnis]